MLIGREQELGRITGLVEGVRRKGAAVVVEGEPGTGRTSLVSAVADVAAAAGLRELRCTGVRGGTADEFSDLHALLHPLLPDVAELPDRQRSALLSAFGLVPGPAPEGLPIGLAALGLVEVAAARQPLLLVVEDVHWLDRGTAEVVGFLARRLAGVPAVLVATVRTAGPDPLRPLSLPRLHLGPLTEEQAAQLLQEVAPALDGRARRRLLQEAAGNPLALRELAAALLVHHGADAAPSLLPTTPRLQRAFLDETAGLPPASRTLLQLAAAAGRVPLPELLAAARLLGAAPADLEPLERAGFLSVVGDRIHWRHPVVPVVVRGAASSVERAAVHRALAAVASEAGPAAWHRAAASYERDEAVAAELEAVAEQAVRRGARADAAAALHRSAALSPDQDERVRRLTRAAELARQAGSHTEAAAAVEEALPLAGEPATLAALTTTQIGNALLAGLPARSVPDVMATVRGLTGPGSARERVRLLAALAVQCVERGHRLEDRRAVEGELAAVDLGHPDPVQQLALVLLDPAARAALRPRLAAMLPLLRTDPQVLVTLAPAAQALHDLVTARAAGQRSAEHLEAVGATADAAAALGAAAPVRLLLGEVSEGLADAERALLRATDLGLPPVAAGAAAVVARARAVRGDTAGAATALELSRELLTSAPSAPAAAGCAWSAGVLALTQRRYRDAWTALEDVAQHPTTALWALGDVVEAAVRSGKAGPVAAVVDDAGRAAATFASAHLALLVHRSRALLATGAEAAEQFERSLEAGATSGTPLELARTRLAYGEWLRRGRRVVDAREQLAAALAAFTAAGARPWAERAAAELRAAGVSPDPSAGSATAPQLTPQETQIARLAATGLSNREIADRLHLSHRTVGAHLHRVYPKLGISSRIRLRDALEHHGHHEHPASALRR